MPCSAGFAGRCQQRRRSARRRYGRSPISSRCSPDITCCVLCAIRWASPAASEICRGCSPRPSSHSLSRSRFTAHWSRSCRAHALYRSFIISSLPISRCSGSSWRSASRPSSLRVCFSSGSASSICLRWRYFGRSWPTYSPPSRASACSALSAPAAPPARFWAPSSPSDCRCHSARSTC